MGLNDLNKIIETTVIIARNEWKYCAEIQTNLAPNLPRVHCLADEMGQVFLNLLMNASHAISEIHKNDNEKGLITISSRQLDDNVEISVEDTGCGIPEKIRARIFDPFFTTKVVGQGTGQGLAICHDVIEKKHGGVLLVDSEEGRGSIFTIRLPLHKDKTAR
jgi:signal transduction histidine kinase